MTTTTEPSTRTGGPSRRWLKPLGYALDWRIDRLQREYLAGMPAARADLARLRRGLGKPAGSVPEIWAITVGAVPAELAWDRDEPSRAEQAAHAAMTLYALHQQSFPGPAHVPAVSFGTAVGRLAGSDGPSRDAVTRRFMAVATAESADEVLVHVRGLVTQLKRAKRGVDYARFADDVLGLLTPGRESGVRLAWGRDFYRTDSDSTDDTTSDDDTTDTDGNQP
jgi:CRISPR system Cascade subunit CasB